VVTISLQRRWSQTWRERVGDCQRFSFEHLNRNLLSKHDVTGHELAFRKEAEASYASPFLVEFFYVPGSGEADAVDMTA
jgi:hypothetical protein